MRVTTSMIMPAILMLAVIISCQKERKLSCDPIVDSWAKDNLSVYESSDRADIINLPYFRQKAIYVGLSGNSKVRIWKGKLALVEEQGLLSKSEFKEYSSLINSLKPEYFDTDYGKEELRKITEIWVEKMRKEFLWDDYKIYDYLESWMTEEERTKSYFLESFAYNIGEVVDTGVIDTTIIDTSEIAVPCECRADIYCKQKGYEICYSDNDRYKCAIVQGCGLWGNDPCGGICINQPW